MATNRSNGSIDIGSNHVIDFEQYLYKNTTLLPSTIQIYVRTIKQYLAEYQKPDKESINSYVVANTRRSHSFYKKYAFKWYCKFIKRNSWYDQVRPVRVRPRKKFGKFIESDKIKQIIEKISDKKYRDIATLMFVTGTRAKEIISLERENVDLDYKPHLIRIKIIGKGDKEGVTFVKQDLRQLLESYSTPTNKYLFLKDFAQFIEKEADFIRVVNNERTNLYRKLREAASSLGISKFGTHDFRRNWANRMRKRGKSLHTIQKGLRHGDPSTTIRYFDEAPEEIEKLILGDST